MEIIGNQKCRGREGQASVLIYKIIIKDNNNNRDCEIIRS
jgi:ribosomal protein S16